MVMKMDLKCSTITIMTLIKWIRKKFSECSLGSNLCSALALEILLGSEGGTNIKATTKIKIQPTTKGTGPEATF